MNLLSLQGITKITVHHIKVITFFLLLAGILISCSTPQVPSSPTTTVTLAPVNIQTTSESLLLTQTPEPPDIPISVWIDPQLPSAINDIVDSSSVLIVVQNQQEASITIIAGTENPLGRWIYLLVSPFPSLREELKSSDLISYWRTGQSSVIKETKLTMSEETKTALTAVWGDPNPDGISSVKPNSLLTALWSSPESIAIIPFEELNPYWKVLNLDGQNPLSPGFITDQYALSLPITFTPSEPDITTGLEIPITNYDRSKLTIVAVTGVTAMVRDTAAIMEDNGLLYPAGDIQAILSSADITHISNEVPFAEDCPAPDPNQESLYFCSKDEYIKLLETVGTDIVELSGDHFGDWGPEAMLHSLTLYRERNWLTYGGGESLSAGLQPVFIEHNGNKIAFIGCNGKAHKRYATASDTNPGASMCAYDWMELEIARLNEQGYLVIATMQHEEIDSFSPVALQQWDFRRLANAGAVIVSGSQAHHPQSFELIGSSLIHYGLGNLFFDQWYLATYNPEEHINKDKAFIDLHIFYAGSHINTRLITLQFIDNARPRLMTDEERSSFLTEVFRASIWDIQN